jgi:hypothetical protein
MKKFILPICFLLAFFSGSANAARFHIGTDESIEFLVDVSLPPVDGKSFYIGHKKTQKIFGLPYYVKSDGLVLGVKGDSRKYLPLPEGAKLQVLQKAGLLPDPLPSAKLDLVDYLFGYSLWLAIVVLFLYYGIKKSRARNN